MAPTETIIWTAVPNGVSVSPNALSTLNISVHVAPNLSGGSTGTLTDFPDFQNWPTTFTNQGLGFDVTFTNGAKTETQTLFAQVDTTILRPDLWTALFSPPAGIEYSPRDPDEPYTKVPVVSYPAGQIAGFLQNTYTSLALASPTAYPSLSDLQPIYGQLGFVGIDGLARLRSVWQQLSHARLSGTLAGNPPYANDFTGATTETSLAALRFYHLPPKGPPPAAALPTVDFHRALTFIGEHRTLQRALGLVFDIAVPVDALQTLGSPLSSDVYVSVVPARPAATAFVTFTPSRGVSYVAVTPRTQCDASTSEFRAHPASSQIVGRELALGDTTSFLVHEIDIDGGGLKNASFADNLVLAAEPQPAGNGRAPDAPQSYAPPSLRSAGLTVSAVNRGLSFVSRLNRSAVLMAGMPNSVPDLTAEDLVRGFVLDVYDAAGNAWHSTAKRDVTYAATGVSPSLTASDEASTDAPPRKQSDPTDSSQQQLNLSEILLRWNGWSNAAPRPGLAIQDDGGVAQGGTAPGPFSQLQITATPTAGTLPRLRFGESYATRARVVDITGNVIPLAAGADVGDSRKRVSALSVYGRHEPIGSPDIYNPNPTPLPGPEPIPGESLKRLVIRDLNPSAGSRRSLAPNRVAELFAEQHGMFDMPASGGGVQLDQGAYTLIVNRESMRYPTTGPGSLTSPVPYLPDPLARGGVLTVLDGALAGKLFQFSFAPAAGGSWPDYRPFGLQLLPGGSQAASVDNTNRLLTFRLTKGDIVKVQLSCALASGDLGVLGLYGWISVSLGGSVPATFRQNVLDGQCWGMTPYTTLELIFAVQKPLLVPTYPVFAYNRQLGWTYAELYGDIVYSPKSTSKTDLRAHWGEPVDGGPGAPAPMGPGAPDTKLLEVQATVFTIPSAQTEQDKREDRFTGRHEFHDTKHRNVTYVGRATSRFTEFYRGEVEMTVPSPGSPQQLKLPGEPDLGLEPGSVTVTNSAGSMTYEEHKAFKIDPTAGTITFLAGGPPSGSTVKISFLPPVSVDTAPVTLNIPSSARPASLAVPFVVPIYEWSAVRKLGGGKIASARSPSALRLFIERPWWSSGIDELLGVITWPQAESTDVVAIPQDVSMYFSDWGADPVFGGRPLPSAHPRMKSFTKAIKHGTNLTIDERVGVAVNVAGHAVEYDPIRELWFCDVEVATGKAYTPMIRLALARYQPNSLPGAELSRIVLADVMSLEPGRGVLVERASATLLKLVSLIGYSYTIAGVNRATGPGLARVTVERRVPQIADETLGWEPVAKPVTMRPSTMKDGLTVWTARNITIPSGGKHRLFIEQFELLPEDQRSGNTYARGFDGLGMRLLYQDLVPL